MAITLRIQKGSTLTYAELDGNFTELDDRAALSYTADSGNNLLYADGTYDFGSNIIKYANAVDQEADLANYDPGDYHGMTMHVHSTGGLYYAHAGAWRKLLTDVEHNDVEGAGYVNPLSEYAYTSTNPIGSSDIDFGSNKILYANVYSQFTDLPSPSTYHGMFAHVHGTGKAYYAHAGAWVELANASEVGTGSLDDLSDVSVSGATSGQVLKYDGTNWAPATDLTADSGSGITLADLSVSVQTAGSANLIYDNTTGVFSYTPPDLSSYSTLTDFSVSVQPVGNANLVYDNTTGVFSYTPPDLSSYALASSVPDTLLDLNIVDGTNGQVLSTDGSGNFSFIDATSSAGDPDQNLFATVASDSGTTTADTTTDTLTISGGTDISTSISGDTLTLSYTGSAGASNFDELTDVSSAGIDVNDIYEAAIVTLRVDNNSSIAYTFDSHYSGDNPTVYAISGTTIAFDLDLIGGHPFELQDSGGTPISDGLVHVSATGTVSTGSAAQGFDSGTLYWRIQESLSGNYQYQCTIHSGMNGTITVKRLSTL